MSLGCSGQASAGTGGVTTLPDAETKPLPGFDGFAVDVQAVDSGETDAGDSASDVENDAATDNDAAGPGADATPVDAVSISCSQTCEIDDDCNLIADPCTATLCKDGCCQVAPTMGVPCDDGVPCNGPDACKNGKCTPALPGGCDDGLACTADECDGEKCHHTVLDGWCHIANSCVQAQAALPGEPCKICDPAQDQDSWSQLSGCCKLDSDCTAKGACDKPTCEVTLGACVIVKIPGCCKSDGDCDDGNLCTTDTCDLGTGNCASTAVTCPGPNACQVASCDPTTGQCVPELLPGWCFIDGACTDSSSTNPNNPCQLCVPGNKPNAWSANPGTLCDDGNACTFSDICTSAGDCKGTKQPGCCQSDSDCTNAGVDCKVGLCNMAVGLCTLSDQPGCCTAGVCCDTTEHLLLPTGTACAANVIGSEYQCNGAEIQKRDFTPGCNGNSATACTAAFGTANAGAWATIDSCPAGTQCTPMGSSVPPTCKLLGSCAGACGGSGTYGCKCSSDCVAAGTCCPDAASVCGCGSGTCCDVSAGVVMATGTPCGSPAGVVQYQCAGNALQQRAGQGKCVGSSACSTDVNDVYWSGWQTIQTCNGGCTAAPDGSSGSCLALTGSCLGSCGVQSANGNCSCNASCHAAGTCCADYDVFGCDYGQICGIQGNTCAGTCGTQSNSSSCWCDSLCIANKDCCPDKYLCGCTP